MSETDIQDTAQAPKPSSEPKGKPRLSRSKPPRIMPQSGVAGSALTAVIAVMCYLGSLALGAVIVINKSVNNWTSDIAGQVTIQISPRANTDINQDIDKALAILRVTRGISAARIISNAQSAKLLEPWLGTGAFLKDLPVPRLVAVSIDRRNPPDFKSLAATIRKNIPSATLDTHRQWQSQITRTAGTLKLVGYAVLLLISLTTAAIVVFATRAAIANNSSTIEVLHLVGAHDSYIARLIQWNFLKLGVRAGLIAGVCGALSFYALNLFGDVAGNGELSASAVRLVSGPAQFTTIDYAAFLLIPIAATFIAIVTARLAIIRILSRVL